MSTKFFNNINKSLFEQLKGIAEGMVSFDQFLAVVGYFRSSGYFKLRKELKDVSTIKILIGINLDSIFKKQNQNYLVFTEDKEIKELYQKDFVEDIKAANYSSEVEEGIFQLCQDLKDKRLELRIHSQKNMHAKFYLCLPKNHSPHTDGWVIMGSSNISESGLGISNDQRYELNIALKDYDDVKYCTDEFAQLWQESVPLSLDDIEDNVQKTYLGQEPSPYELYIKVLIDTFGSQVEDSFSMDLPEGVKELKYQTDAVVQGYQMLRQHNGLFLSDVVGLGKTMIATMIAKRFIEANGSNTNILIIYPPALERNWRETFKLFNINRHSDFISNGSLSKVIEGDCRYRQKEEYNLIIVDESHGFRNDDSGKYDQLQQICKSQCLSRGLLNLPNKAVMLLSATPLNNRPEDLLNQILLFQNSQECTIDGIPSLKNFFNPLIGDYNSLMRSKKTTNTDEINREIEKIYDKIRTQVIDKLTIRRTRNNILNDEFYREDLKQQGIIFPTIRPPQELVYSMTNKLSDLFYKTLKILTATKDDDELTDIDKNGFTESVSSDYLNYSRYRAVEYLDPEFKEFKQGKHISNILAMIYRVLMVKRLESSFYAFKQSLKMLLTSTQDMINMYEADQVIIAPDLKIKDLFEKGLEIEDILELAQKKGYEEEDICFPQKAFFSDFYQGLLNDRKLLSDLYAEWEAVEEDPKFELFRDSFSKTFMNKAINSSRKLVLFSESVDTLNYLERRIKADLGRSDILKVTAQNRKKVEAIIRENFDANNKDYKDEYNILLSSDVLAEGVNLHRSNTIINYDAPWNATRLMQRIGRVNRIGSTSDEIYNYLFYPSQQGDKEISLYKNALIKLQGFHTSFGEDAQIYSKEEVVKEFTLFNPNIRDSVDKRLELLREVRRLYQSNPKLYKKIKTLPPKIRVLRKAKTEAKAKQSIVFISSRIKTEYYLIDESGTRAIDFLEAVALLRAEVQEKGLKLKKEYRYHFQHVNNALEQYTIDKEESSDTQSLKAQQNELGKTELRARKFLRDFARSIGSEDQLYPKLKALETQIETGIFNQLPKAILKLQKSSQDKNKKRVGKEDMKTRQAEISRELLELYQKYGSGVSTTKQEVKQILDTPQIIISETFI